MIEPILFFVLGVLSAGLIALIIVPAIWRRAVRLTRRRIEASMPLTANEMLAEKDKVRAEFAMATRRLEMSLKHEKEKLAEQAIAFGRQREDARQIAVERDDKAAAMLAQEAESARLASELADREDKLRQVNDKLDQARRALEEGAAELERVNSLYEEAAYTASGRQIELVARESEIEKLNDDLARFAREQREFDVKTSSADVERFSSADALSKERKRATVLEGKIERMVAAIADHEEKIERREHDLKRLKEQLDVATRNESEMKEKLQSANTQRLALESRIAVLSQEIANLGGGNAAGAGDIRADDENGRLEARLTEMTRENEKLREDLAALQASRMQPAAGETRGGALLREQIKDLAAEMVSMAIRMEGPESPAAKAVAQSDNGSDSKSKGGTVVSLADRIRALRKTEGRKK